jgi:hypothetical protein
MRQQTGRLNHGFGCWHRHHLNNRDPTNAPAIEQNKMAPPYQTAMKDTESSAQCSA